MSGSDNPGNNNYSVQVQDTGGIDVTSSNDTNSVEDQARPNSDTLGNNSTTTESIQETSHDSNNPIQETSHDSNNPIQETSHDSNNPIQETSHDSNNPDAVTESSQTRDASSESGNMCADDVYKMHLREYYPDYMEKVYKVPWTYFGTSPVQSKKYETQDNEHFPHWQLAKEHISGDNAEKRVADSLEWLLNTEHYPAFILTSYNFRGFCNQKDESPTEDMNLYKGGGEHDIVIIHYEYGIFFIQVKACNEDTIGNSRRKARAQLSEDEQFFRSNFKDFKGTISPVVALPNIRKTSTPKVEDLSDDHLPLYSSESGKKEEELRRWWKTQQDNCKGFGSFAEYRRVVVKYVGRKSTVKLRSPADAVAGMGNRYMNIVLTPQQIYIQNNDLPRLIIRGEHGSGKTVMLILKARQLMAQKVCIISMARSPLLQVLENSVKYDMAPVLQNNVSVSQVSNHLELSKILTICAEEKRHVFIDEVPSSLGNDETLKKVISSYPEECLMWAVTSSERSQDLRESLKEIFRDRNERLAVAVLNKVLRCPPSIYPRCKAIQDPGKTREFSEIEAFFSEHGLPPSEDTPSEDSKQWSDFTVIDNVTKEMNINQWLDVLKCPLTYLPNIAQYSQRELLLKVEALKDPGDIILLTDSIHPHYEQTYTKRIPIEDGGNIFVKQNYGFERICSQKQFQQLLNRIEEEPNTFKLIVDVKSYLYHFLKKLKYQLVTPYSTDVLRSNSILFTTESEFAGFERKMVLRISNTKVRVNQELQRIEGPKPQTVDHSAHIGPVQECKTCQDQLNSIFGELGLGKIFVDDHAISSNSANEQRSKNVIEQHKEPSVKLGLCDVLVLDDTQPKHDVVNLLSKINLPPKVSHYGYEDGVVYTTPDMFRGLEKKVVMVVTDNGCTDLAVSRCSSQLIVLKTNSDP